MQLVDTVQVELTGDFSDSVKTWQDFLTVVNKLSGVTVISSIKHDFPGGGFSGLVLIAESHAAIHTWTEYNRAWAELVTCGDRRALTEFVEYLSALGIDCQRIAAA